VKTPINLSTLFFISVQHFLTIHITEPNRTIGYSSQPCLLFVFFPEKEKNTKPHYFCGETIFCDLWQKMGFLPKIGHTLSDGSKGRLEMQHQQ